MNEITRSSSKQTPQTEIKFEPKSVGYKALIAAANGQLDKLKECLAQDRGSLNGLHVVTKEGDLYTPTHYALAKKQFQAVAYLLNQGVAWTISSHKSQGEGSTAIEILNRLKQGLCHVLQSLVDSEDLINLGALVSLLTSPDLSVERRREVINHPKLRMSLCKKLKKDDALFIMGTLLIGSQQWKGMQTDFPLWSLRAGPKDVLGFDKTMCCNQMVVYASILTGMISPREAMEFFQKNAPSFKKEDHDRLISPFTSEKERIALRLPFNRQLSMNLGLVDRSEKNRLDLKKPHHGEPITQIMFVESESEFIDHYGILHRNENGNYLIHITEGTRCVVLEDAERALQIEGQLSPIVAVYTGMLPNHE